MTPLDTTETDIMWVFLSDSFLSIVDKGDPSGATLLVRARVAGDIERVFPGVTAVEGAGTDYRYRARVDRQIVAEKLTAELRSLRYANFKSTVKDRRRHEAYLEVWDAMMDYQSDLRRIKDSSAK